MHAHEGAIVVGVDDTPQSALALRWAAADARAHHRPLHVLHAYRWPLPTTEPGLGGLGPVVTEEEVVGYAEEVLTGAVALARQAQPGLEVVAHAVRGTPARALVAESAGAAAVVVGSRGLGAVAGTVVGSVGSTLAARARCPVVVLRGPAGNPAEGAGVVVGVDGTAAAEAALAFGFDHASRYGVPLRAVLCWYPYVTVAGRWSARAAEQAVARHEVALAEALAGWQEKYPDVTVERRVLRGHPVETLVTESLTAHLLVVGARGHHPRGDGLLGSVTQGVLHHATCPVAVVRT